MRKWLYTTLTCALLSTQTNTASAQSAPGPESAQPARTAWRFDPEKRCPDLRIAPDGTAAVVVFLVGRTGVPSRTSIKLSSHSEGLDAAAVSCIAKLRFQPAIHSGDGEPVDSWQEMAFDWAAHQPAPATLPATMASDAGARQESSSHETGTVTVRVCTDDAGKPAQVPAIVRSSGNPALDQAAVKIAASGSSYYRPATTLDGKPVSGCARLMIEFETK
jgi:TonB family protein